MVPYLMGITTTVRKAQESLTEDGYKAVSCMRHDDPVYPLIPKEARVNLEEEELRFDLYLFEMKKDGFAWGIAVNPMTEEVLRIQTRMDDLELSEQMMWIKERNQ